MAKPEKTMVLVNKLYPLVSKQVQANLSAYKRVIQRYIESRSTDLYDIAPFKRIPFTADDADEMFTALKIKKSDVTDILSETFYWNMDYNPRAAKDEFTMVMMMAIKYFVIKNDNKNAEISAIYLAFSGKFYPSIHSGKFKYPPDKYRHVMEYVVNNELSGKFDLKREGSLFGAVRSICRTWLTTYEKQFKDPHIDDRDITLLVQQLHGRIKSFLGNIAEAYYAVYNDNGKYMTYASDSNDDETFRVADNNSMKAERCVENAMHWITTHGVSHQICYDVHDSNVKTDEIQSIIESIQDQPENIALIRELLGIMVFEFFDNSAVKDVCTIQFITFNVQAKPNTKNKNILRQKQIIETWLDENSPQYRKRKSREGTKSSYYKSVLMYYAYVINMANK